MNVTWQPGMTLADMEKMTILAALRFYRGNKTQTAEALGITSKTVYNKIEAYSLKAEVAEMDKSVGNPDFQAEPKSVSELDLPQTVVTPLPTQLNKKVAGQRK